MAIAPRRGWWHSFRCVDSDSGDGKGSCIMGDKSPKANQKQSKQKQGKANAAAQNKNAATAAKQVARGKK